MARLLCVDDDLDALHLKRSILERSGYKVDVTSSVDCALSMLTEVSYDAVLSDWWFGQENAMKLVVKAKETNNIPVLVLSGFIEDAFVSLGSAADFYMQKPVNAIELTAVLEEIIVRSPKNESSENC